MPDLELTRSTTELLAAAGAIGAGLALLLALVAHLRFRRLRREYSMLQGDGDGASLLSVVRRQQQEVARLQEEVAAAGRALGAARADLADAIRHVSVIRYDAFADMGGRLSFSAALLDDAGDGLVLTSINGRTETRSYAKGVKAGASEHTLSPEEEQAIAFALRGAGSTDRPSATDSDIEGVSVRI